MSTTNSDFVPYHRQPVPPVPFKDSPDTLEGHRILRFSGAVGDGYDFELETNRITSRTTSPLPEIASLLTQRIASPPENMIATEAVILEVSGDRGLFGRTEVDWLLERSGLRHAAATEMIDLLPGLPIDPPERLVACASSWDALTAFGSYSGGMAECHPAYHPKAKRVGFVRRVGQAIPFDGLSYVLVLPITTPQRALDLIAHRFRSFR